MKKNKKMNKSRKIRGEKKAVRKPRLTKEEREARKLKLQEERAAKKAERIAKREAKKQKEAEKKAAAKAKKEAKKQKEAARLQKQKEREAAKKAKAKARAEKKAACDTKKIERKPRGKKLDAKAKKVAIQEKIEAERNEWKALSAIRRYVKDEAKAVGALDGDKLDRKLKKLEKMGYEVLRGPDGKLLSVGYSFKADIKLGKATKVEVGDGEKTEKPAKKERKPRKPRADKVEDAQPQDSVEAPIVPEEPSPEAEEKLLTDEEILAAAAQDKEAGVEVLAGDTFKDETEIAEDDSLKNPDDNNDLDDDGDDEEEADGNEDEDDILGGGADGISSEQAEYRREAFREMEGNGTWD